MAGSTSQIKDDAMKRRDFMTAVASGFAAMLLMPLQALAAVWNREAFEATKLPEALKGLHADEQVSSQDIEISAPDRAENGAVVQVEILSRIPNTEAIALLVDKNPTPLIANFMFSNGAEPYVVTRIKMAESSEVHAIVKAGDRYYEAKRFVEVLENGCN
jgi:sulfur-oxidizing protein SoxY